MSHLTQILEQFNFREYDYDAHKDEPIEWRLVVKEGRQRWIPFPQSILKQFNAPQSLIDIHLLNKPSNFELPNTYVNDIPLNLDVSHSGSTNSNSNNNNSSSSSSNSNSSDDDSTVNNDTTSPLDYVFNKTNNYQSNLSESMVNERLLKAIDFYGSVQTDDGHWAGDYGGPMFLLPGIVIVMYICGEKLPRPFRYEMIRYIQSKQNKDGGYGLHIEGHSTIFGTVLNYVALRLLGVSSSHQFMKQTLEFLSKEPANGTLGCPQWAKLYLCVLGLMHWDCIDPIPPELWLLPDWFPYIQPGKWWCHCRVVYLPMAYLYGLGKVYDRAESDTLIQELRNELYMNVSGIEYSKQPWSKFRSYVNPRDNYHPFTQLYASMIHVFVAYERYFKIGYFRKRALDTCIDHIKYEDSVTNHICIGPVNKVLNMLSVYFHEGSQTEHFQAHLDRVYDYLWLSDDGMKYQGYNGSQLWDTAFATQAIAEYYKRFKTSNGSINIQPLLDRPSHLQTLLKAYNFINFTQVKEDVPNRMAYYRQQSKGGWPFSTKDHGWPISDCTAEGIKSVLSIHDLFGLKEEDSNHQRRPCLVVDLLTPISSKWTQNPLSGLIHGGGDEGGEKEDEQYLLLDEERLTYAVRVILSMFNGGTNGGWATYELSRTHSWIEIINPAALYGEIMIDYPHTECTSACITALLQFKKFYPNSPYIPLIDDSIKHAISVIESKQTPEGGWYGGWAVCFCYGTWFAITALNAIDPVNNVYSKNEIVRKGLDFIVSKQQEQDGGWGESYLSCVTHKYSQSETSRVINTAWALLSLMTGDYPNLKVIEMGIYFLLRKQLPNGDFPQESISGVFNHNCMITYTNYRNIFPIWALSMYMRKYHPVVVKEQ